MSVETQTTSLMPLESNPAPTQVGGIERRVSLRKRWLHGQGMLWILNPCTWEDVEIYGSHLAVLYNLWMSGAPLVYCVYSGAQSSGATDIPLSVNWKVFGYSYLTREPQ